MIRHYSEKRAHAFKIFIDSLSMVETIEICLSHAKHRQDRVPFVVTPNVDHIVKLQKNNSFLESYHNASLVVTDGKPVKMSLQLLGYKIPEVVTGSDLVPGIFTYCDNSNFKISVFLFGSGPNIAAKAAQNIELNWHNIEVVGYYSPPFGFENDPIENSKIINIINKFNPDILIIGLGAPKQELWINLFKDQIHSGIALCVGATIDFLAGEKKRAPGWMQFLGIEWFYRLLSEPKRLYKRYLIDFFLFPFILIKEIMRKYLYRA